MKSSSDSTGAEDSKTHRLALLHEQEAESSRKPWEAKDHNTWSSKL